MNARFGIDLLHPGTLGHTWREWFVGPRGPGRLGLAALTGAGILLLVLVAGILPAQSRRASERMAVAGLERDLQARTQELMLLRANLRALADEARQQVRWGEVLTALSRETPATVRLELVEVTRPAPAAPAPGGARPAPGRGERALRIDAVTPLREGAAPLLDLARLMAGLMRDPEVSRRFVLRSWEVKPPGSARLSPDDGPVLGATITLAERAP